MPRKSRPSFVDFMAAVGVGHSEESRWPEPDMHCPQMIGSGNNGYRKICEMRRNHELWRPEIFATCSNYPNCKPYKQTNFAHESEVTEDDILFDKRTDVIASAMKAGYITRDICKMVKMAPERMAIYKRFIFANPDIYGKMPDDIRKRRKS